MVRKARNDKIINFRDVKIRNKYNTDLLPELDDLFSFNQHLKAEKRLMKAANIEYSQKYELFSILKFRILIQLGAPKKAITIGKELLKMNPNNTEIIRAMMSLYNRIMDKKNILQIYEEHKDDLVIKFSYALYLFKNCEYGKSIDILNEIVACFKKYDFQTHFQEIYFGVSEELYDEDYVFKRDKESQILLDIILENFADLQSNPRFFVFVIGDDGSGML